MTKIIGAPTLDDALSALKAEVAENEGKGERTLVFCEDRLTLLAERAILEERGGTFLTEVSTFARFLRGEKRVLSKHGSVMEISALLAEYRGELGCFGENSAQAVYETIAQLSASRVTPEMLAESAETCEGLLRLKLKDLSKLFAAYESFLSDRGLLDENGYLGLLPSRIEGGGLETTHVIFFAFPSFTRQACEGVRAAIRAARSVAGIFLAGRENFYTNEAPAAFRRIAEAFGDVVVQQRGSTLSGEAERLRKILFSPEGAPGGADSEAIRMFSAADPADEMNTIAALIRKYVAEGKRYRDLAVLIGDACYYPAACKAFEAYGIPYYADRKRPYSEHPFCAFALAVLSAVAGGPSPDEAEAVAASVYFGDDGRYRNYLSKYGAYRGAVRREIKQTAAEPEDLGYLLRCRDRMNAALGLFRAKDDAAAYAEGLRKLWRLVGGEEITKRMQESAGDEEKSFLGIERLEEVLSETEQIAGGRVFSAREFATLLKNGLEAVEVSMFPRRSDAVFVGDVTESRICRSPVLFCAGLTEELPGITQDTAVITDGEIEKLKSLQVEIEPAIAVVNARARESLALNLCAFRDALYLSCPVCKNGGETAPSEIFAEIGQAFSSAPLPQLFPYNVSRPDPAMLAYFTLCDDAKGRSDEQTSRLIARYSSLREAFLRGYFGHGTSRDPESLRRDLEKPAVPEAGMLYFGKEISPTLLESYFACPYKSFAERGLRLAEREERTALDAADAGTFVHAVLESAARRFHEFPDEEACGACAEEIARKLLETTRFSSIPDTAAGDYAAGRLVEEAVAVTKASYRQLVGSKYRVRALEEEIRIPALRLGGKADRVDESENGVRVIDYKTGGFDDSPTAYYTGRRLQLELYLLAAAKGKRPDGAFYFPAADDFTRANDSDGKFRMKGFFCSDPEIVKGMDLTRDEGQKSMFFDGGGKTEKGMSREEFDNFLAYSLLVSGQAEEEMRAGNIRPSPYEGVCAYCTLKGLCGFSGEPRKEGAVRCGEIASIARGPKEDKE